MPTNKAAKSHAKTQAQPMPQTSNERIEVEIFGSTYALRGGADGQAVRALAADIDSRMHELARNAPDADPVKVAILTALRIGDEAQQSVEEIESHGEALADRARACADRLERALAAAEPTAHTGSGVHPENSSTAAGTLDGTPSVG